MRIFKKEMCDEELIYMDFSENYNTTFKYEIQYINICGNVESLYSQQKL